ncbi:MAG: phosphate ABC transporter substrate-binding protein PstS [Microbacteriaceae bacterium]|nr:phosphate ABC transporter substrate-binding protein PstS [Microbacteriaceae bacterium]
MLHRAWTLGLALAIIGPLALSGCAVNEMGDLPSDLSGTLDASGSSAQGSAQEVWVAGFQRLNASVTVNYDPAGSGAGREAFLAGGTDLAGSDSPLSDDELAGEFGGCAAGSRGIDLPLYISPIAVIFNVDGLDQLRLSPQVLAAVFRGDIERWDDAAIVELNPDSMLPNAAITAVHRSDDSGTTKNFTDYLAQAAPGVWDKPAGDAFPYATGEAAQGNSGVVSAVTNGSNTIGYADASKAGDLGIAQLEVAGEFVAPSANAAARIIDISPRVPNRTEHDLAFQLDRTPDEAGIYPLVLLSYLIVCEEYPDAGTAELVRAYLSYIASDDGQRASAASAGSAPISAALAEEVNAAIASIR